MTELSTFAKYPFLNESKLYIKNHGPTVDELLKNRLYERARTIGIERVDNALKNRDVGNRTTINESDCIMELLSYPIARMIAVCVGDTYLKRRHALGEAYRAYKHLLNEPTSKLINIAEEFQFKVKNQDDTNRILIYFKDYLRNAPTRYKEWKMINRGMNKGYVHIIHKDLARIIEEALRNRINNELDARTCNKTIIDIFSSDIKRYQNYVMMHHKKMEAAPVGKLSIEKLSPCMKTILSAIQSGENVPHMGRFALVAFLNSLKLNTDDILKLFSHAPDYEEDKTRYQVEHITGSSSTTSYKPPGCDKMRTYGICPVEEMDALCKKINHPRSYYDAKWRMEKNKK